MASDVIDLSLIEPPDGWTLEQFNNHISRLIEMYRGVYLRLEPEYLTLADRIHEVVWTFRDSRLLRFPGVKDNWLLLEGTF